MDKRILLLKKQMLANLQHTPTVKQMAQLVNLSEPHLQQLFKKEVGMSPIRYLRNVRFGKARKLLEESFLRVKEIGFTVGMPDQSRFVRDFKQEFGATPSKYRRQHWMNTEDEESDVNKS